VERIEQESDSIEIDVVEFIAEIISEIQATYKQSKKEVTLESNSGNINTKINKEILSCITANLIENAVKYSNKQVRIGIEKKDIRLNLIFEDDGPGILENQREQVFEPFYRLEGKPDYNSHGLGLAIVKACIQAEKGEILLGNSNLGGLKATVSIPLRS
jgi:signal transduction histidine kinase